MELVYQIAGPAELEEILAFAEDRLKTQEPDAMARTFAAWHARWRRESLEHYLKLGWSFIVRRDGSPIAGFFLAQPFVFMRGQTQTLWVEHIDADAHDALAGLADVAVRLAREKHFQRVLFSEENSLGPDILQAWPHTRMADAIIEVRTAKA